MEKLLYTENKDTHSLILDNLNKNIENTSFSETERITTITWDALKNNLLKEDNSIFSSINTEYILSQIDILEKNNDYYSQWFAAKIFLVEAFVSWEQKKLLIIKDLSNKNDNSNKKILNEYSQYLDSYKLLWNQWDSLVRIPKPHWILNDHQWNMILILDFIPWMTIFSFKISIILPILYDILIRDLWNDKVFELLWSKEKYINLKTDKEVKSALLKTLEIFRFNNRGDFYEQYLNFYDKSCSSDAYKGTWLESQMAKIFDNMTEEYNLGMIKKENIHKIKTSLISNILLLNKNNIYHNDMNQRNVILWENGYIYIIDFDKSTNIPKKSNNMRDINYIQKYNWQVIDWDFKVINLFNSLEKKN